MGDDIFSTTDKHLTSPKNWESQKCVFTTCYIILDTKWLVSPFSEENSGVEYSLHENSESVNYVQMEKT